MSMKMTTFWFDPQMKTTLRVGAARQGVPMGDLIRTAVVEYIERHPEVFFATNAQQTAHSDQASTQEVA